MALTEREMPGPHLFDDEFEASQRRRLDVIVDAYRGSQQHEAALPDDQDRVNTNVEWLYTELLNMSPDVSLPDHSGFLAWMLAVAIDELSKA